MTYNLSKKKKRAFTLNTYHVSVYKTILKVHKQRLKETGRENKGPQWSVQTLLKKGGVLSIRYSKIMLYALLQNLMFHMH